MIFDLKSYTAEIICDKKATDATIDAVIRENELDLYINATCDRPKYIKLHWDADTNNDILVLGDTWERSYGNLEFCRLADNKRYMPWYFIATDKTSSFCFGVKTGCNSFVSFEYDTKGITALVDCGNGGNGVHLNGRRL